MKNSTYSRQTHGQYTISTSSIDESVLSTANYVLATFTIKGQAVAININNNFAYPIVGKRFDKKLKEANPSLSDSRCYSLTALGLSDLKKHQ